MLVDLKELKAFSERAAETGYMPTYRTECALIAIAERLDRLCDLLEKAQEKWI